MTTKKKSARNVEAEKRYEAARKRPGAAVTIRISEDEVSTLDAKRGKLARAAWLKRIIKRELGSSEL